MELSQYFEFVSVPRIAYGPNSLKGIGRIASKLGCSKAFIIADRVFVDNGSVEIIEKSLSGAGIEPVGTLTDVPPDSEANFVKKGYDQASAAGAEVIIAIGGGSTLDTAKGIRVMLAEGGVLPEGVGVIKNELPPMIAVPTTAGTGSEATSAAVIRDKARGMKISYTDPSLMPSIAILDPTLTVTMPKEITAGTGMDALSHAVGSMHSIISQPISEGLSLQAISLIANALPKAVKDPEDVITRGEMMLAATIAGMAFSNTLVGIEHAAAHACGAAYRLPHGISCGMFLPYAMEFNLGTTADAAYARIAAAMGVNTTGMDTMTAAMHAVRAVRDLAVEIGIPSSLETAGVPEDGLDVLVDKAFMDGTMMTNPRQPSEVQLKAFFKKVWMGLEPCDKILDGKALPQTEKKPAAEKAAQPEEAPKKASEETKEEKPFTVQDMYDLAGNFVKKLFGNEEVTAPLKESGLKMRFQYFDEQWGDEEAMITVDCSADPINIQMGECDIEPIVTMRMSRETARLFWLQKLNLMGAVSTGDIQVSGAINEAMRLLPVLKPGFEMFKEVTKGD